MTEFSSTSETVAKEEAAKALAPLVGKEIATFEPAVTKTETGYTVCGVTITLDDGSVLAPWAVVGGGGAVIDFDITNAEAAPPAGTAPAPSPPDPPQPPDHRPVGFVPND